MVKVKEDLTGRVFGRLTVICQDEDYISPSERHYPRWLCECSCQEHNIISVGGAELKDKKHGTKSCGCLVREVNHNIHKKYNSYDLDNQEYGIGYTDNGEEFWFDKEDYDLIKEYYWYYDNHGYVRAFDCNSKKQIRLHMLVMQPIPDGMVVDHKTHPVGNSHKKDNRKSNLEYKTFHDNVKNQGCRLTNNSGTTGVCWHKKSQKWMAYICVDYHQIHLGEFDNKDDAIKIRKEAEVKYFGSCRYDENN